MSAVQDHPTILVTGVTGYIAAHVAEQLLEQGYPVRGTLRSQAKGDFLRERFSKYGDKFELVEVSDLEKAGAFDDAVKGAGGIIHVASPFHLNAKKPEDLIEPAVNGTLSLLNAAATYGNASRVVLTSSFAAMMHYIRPDDHMFSAKDFNDHSTKLVKEKGVDAGTEHVYFASKYEAEMAAWKFMSEKKPKFDLAVINPVYVFGPAIQKIDTAKDINTSVAMVYGLASGQTKQAPTHGRFDNFVDVRDVATAHIRAMQIPAAGGQSAEGHRFIASAGGFSNARICSIIRKQFPELKGVPEVEDKEAATVPTDADSTPASQVLNMKWIGLEQSVVDTVESVKKFI